MSEGEQCKGTARIRKAKVFLGINDLGNSVFQRLYFRPLTLTAINKITKYCDYLEAVNAALYMKLMEISIG